MRRSELEALRVQTAAIDKGRKANERELAKWTATKEMLESDMRDLQKRKEAKKSKEQKEKERADARKFQVTLERNTERQRQALAKAADTSMELQQMQEIVNQMAAQCNLMAGDLEDDDFSDDDDDAGFENIQSKRNKKKTPPKTSRRPPQTVSLADLPSPPTTLMCEANDGYQRYTGNNNNYRNNNAKTNRQRNNTNENNNVNANHDNNNVSNTIANGNLWVNLSNNVNHHPRRDSVRARGLVEHA